MADEVHCSVQDRIATVTLNRPAKRNALNMTVVEGLSAIFGRLEQDPDVRVVVVRGAGPVFCAGMDLRELGTRLGEAKDPERRVTEVFQEIERSRHPTIAMVQGDAFAGGFLGAMPGQHDYHQLRIHFPKNLQNFLLQESIL